MGGDPGVDGRRLLDKLFKATVVALSVAVLLPLFHIVGTIIYEGGRTLLEGGLGFLAGPPPLGIGPALAGSAVLVVLTTLLGVPVAFLTAVLAVEYPESLVGRAAKLLSKSFVEIPTILVGVLMYTLIVVPMGSFSALAGAAALAVVILPYVYTYVEEALSSIPRTYREAAFSLGLTRAKALLHVFMGIARRGIATGILIGVAKAAGETAPLLFTIGGGTQTYFRGLGAPIDAVPLLIYQYVQMPSEAYHRTAWGAALVLTLLYLAVFVAVRRAVKEVKY